MKSHSLKVQHLEESVTVNLASAAIRLRREGVDIVSLATGEPDFPTPLHVKMAGIQAIEENFTHYTPLEGIHELIEAIIQKLERDNNLSFEPPQILVTSGGKHAIFNALQAICNPGDEVVVIAPYWVSFPEMVKLADARPVIVSALQENRFKITPKQLRQAINNKTKALLFNSPCNPTGAVYSQGEIEELADIVRQTGIYVVSDEVYEKLTYDGAKHFSIGSIREIHDQVLTVGGVSKTYAMTGWRLGFLVGNADIVRLARRVQSQSTSNANSIAQRASLAALTGSQDEVQHMVEEYQQRRDYLVDQLRKIPGIVLEIPKGAMYLFPSVKAFVGKRPDGVLMKDDVDICRFLLEQEHVVVVPGSPFGGKNYIRISFACSMKECEKGIRRVQRGLKMLAEAY
jgi:aspartate aminotransferase